MRAWLPYASLGEARQRLGPLPDQLEIDVIVDDQLPPAGADEVVLIGLPNAPSRQLLDQVGARALPRLRWVHLASAGYENVLGAIPARLGLCNAAGVHDTGTAELAIGLALAALRRLDVYAVDRLSSRFHQVYSDTLADQRVLIVGYGHIGSAIERRLAGFEVASVTRVARTARVDPVVHPVGDLPQLVGQADVIFLSLPATDQTRHIVDADLLARLADGTLIVNVGRGALLDLAALRAEQGRIRAALDVTEPEPLPGDHWLWRAPFVTWTPHVGGACRSFEPRYDALMRAQLARLAAGQPLVNVVRSPS
jgi:phosphoglycerate dehydrogenase-like enzyme